jgi:hypothetical protein
LQGLLDQIIASMLGSINPAVLAQQTAALAAAGQTDQVSLLGGIDLASVGLAPAGSSANTPSGGGAAATPTKTLNDLVTDLLTGGTAISDGIRRVITDLQQEYNSLPANDPRRAVVAEHLKNALKNQGMALDVARTAMLSPFQDSTGKMKINTLTGNPFTAGDITGLVLQVNAAQKSAKKSPIKQPIAAHTDGDNL